jgi:hypothetical protein
MQVPPVLADAQKLTSLDMSLNSGLEITQGALPLHESFVVF